MTVKNKVVYNGETLIDLTADTVTAESLAAGVTAHDASGEAITGTAFKNIYYVKGTQTAATGSWTGVLDEVDEIYEGLVIAYWLPFAGSGNATLNLTLKDGSTTGAIPMYIAGTSRQTTQNGANTLLFFVYQTVTISGTSYTGWWRYADNNTTYSKMGNLALKTFKAQSVVYRYQFLFQTDTNTITPLNNVSNSTATTKAMLTDVEFDPFGYIFYYYSTTTVAANAYTNDMICYQHDTTDLRYAFNCGSTLTVYKPVYLKVSIQSNGMCKIANSMPLVQELPSTADGYHYIFLGIAVSTYQMNLRPNHPVYYHDGTEIRRLESIDTASTASPGLMSAADKAKLDGIDTGANKYSLPTASASQLGGVKVGSGLSITNGILSGLSMSYDSTEEALIFA